jgi:hypothetical protein
MITWDLRKGSRKKYLLPSSINTGRLYIFGVSISNNPLPLPLRRKEW